MEFICLLGCSFVFFFFLKVKGKSTPSPNQSKKANFKSKITKITPRKSKLAKDDDLHWFDSDAVFGFGDGD